MVVLASFGLVTKIGNDGRESSAELGVERV
jgi:hypothetical protein